MHEAPRIITPGRTLTSHETTFRFGERLASFLRVGDVIGLVGPLGAGKTLLTKGIVAGRGGDPDAVVSPTFTLMQQYATGDCIIHHMDVYRLGSADEFLDLGVDDLLERDGICVIEWADRVASAFPDHALWIEIDYGQTVDCRRIVFKGDGQWRNRLDVDALFEADLCAT